MSYGMVTHRMQFISKSLEVDIHKDTMNVKLDVKRDEVIFL